jgi:CRP/FNR family cyclic AMP-dependent transcriptional regulator
MNDANAPISVAPALKNGTRHIPLTETIVSKHPFLQGMTPHQLRLLGDHARQVIFKADEYIFREGDPANRFYLIRKGKVALESYIQDKGNTVIQIIGAGDVLGWSWLFPPYFWHFDARSLEPTDAIFIYATPLRDECEADHDLGYELIKRMAEVMARRLQATRKQSLGLPGLSNFLISQVANQTSKSNNKKELL